jgi:flagellar hook-associated protein 1 FlgK
VQPIILDSADSGVGDALTKFFDSWSALAGNPSDTGLKLQVQQAGENLAGQIRGGYLQLQDQKGEQTSQITQTLNDIQSKANAIADLNKQIVHAKALGAEPNDLEDQRDQAIQDLSSLVDIHTSEQSNGAIAVTLGQMTLVDGDGARQVPMQWDASKSQLAGGQVPVDVKSGKLAGLFAALNKTTSYQSQFDDLANSLRTQVNSLYQGAKNQAGLAGQNFFKDVPLTNPATPQTGAIDFDVEDSIKQDSTSIAAGPSGNASDGAVALQLSQLRQVSIASLNSRTFGQYFSDVATKIGSDVANAQSAASTNTSVVQQVDSQIQSISGVSLDDEMANMLRFQRSYQAAAKMLSMFDQTTEDLLGILH